MSDKADSQEDQAQRTTISGVRQTDSFAPKWQ